MVGASLRHAGEELLDRRDGLRVYRDSGAVMGIPLLHPWANRLAGDEYELHGRHVRLPAASPLVRRDENGLPIHGLLAAHPDWAVLERDAGERRARLRARLEFGAPRRVPVPARARARGHADAARADDPPDRRRAGADRVRVPPVPAAARRRPRPLARRDAGPPPPRARRARDPDRTGHAPVPARFRLGNRAFDDGYDGIAERAQFTIAGGGRAITVTHEAGYPVAQVYSPAGAPYICLEPMTAPVNALRAGAGLRRLAPGYAFTATFSITVTGG